jgi:hypothetical protein
MRIRQIAVLHVPFATLSDALAPATATSASIAEGWSAFTGKSGGIVGLRASEDATLAMPLAPFEVGEDLAVHLRELLGDALDRHADERGVFVLADGPVPNVAPYDKLVAGPGAWIPRVADEDPRLQKSAGWSFEAAALLRDAAERNLPKEASDAATNEPALDKPAPDAGDGAPSAG